MIRNRTIIALACRSPGNGGRNEETGHDLALSEKAIIGTPSSLSRSFGLAGGGGELTKRVATWMTDRLAGVRFQWEA